jgi:hypothetical protein
LLAVAWAAPTFVSEHATDVQTARDAWRAAAVCAGWEGQAHKEVEIVRGFIPGNYLGRALYDAEGLYRIELSADEGRLAEVIVHEVAHAWVSGGPPALTDGEPSFSRTVRCIACQASRRYSGTMGVISVRCRGCSSGRIQMIMAQPHSKTHEQTPISERHVCFV